MTAEHAKQLLQFWANEKRLQMWLWRTRAGVQQQREAKNLVAAASTRLRALQQSGVL